MATKLAAILLSLLCLTISPPLAASSSILNDLSVARWINLLRYVNQALQPEEKVPHDDHLNYNEHVELVSDRLIKHFFNDQWEVKHSDDGQAPTFIKVRFPVDFLIMLDSSSSIGTENFEKAIQILTQLVKMFDENDFIQDTLRLSMVSFSEPDKVVHHFPFTRSQSKNEIMRKINETEYHNGTSTSTALGLWYADSIFTKSSREGVTRVILLATDGWSSETDLPFGVLWPASRLKKRLGVKIYAWGIGDEINHNELKAVASSPSQDHLFEVSSYKMMADIIKRVEEKHFQANQ